MVTNDSEGSFWCKKIDMFKCVSFTDSYLCTEHAKGQTRNIWNKKKQGTRRWART